MSADQWLRALPWFVIAASSVLFVLATVGRDWWHRSGHSYAPRINRSAVAFLLALAAIGTIRLIAILDLLSGTTERITTYVALWTLAAVTLWTLTHWYRELP